MKVPFDIKFRPQIESGEYKVVTGDDRPVRIISWDKKVFGGRIEIVGLVPATQGDTETVQLYCPDGTLIASGWNEKFKLFIITPETELTEFEKAVRVCIAKNLTTYAKGDRVEVRSTVYIDDDTTKKMAAELLDLARKELQSEYDGKAMLHVSEKSYEIGKRDGKAEALKDLPRWRTWKNGACGNSEGIPIAIVKKYCGGYVLTDLLCGDTQYIMLSDLEKLPKED